jgi:hypothetical protein
MILFGGVLIYLSLIGAAAGLVSILKPLRFLGIRSRKKGLLVLGLGFLGFLAGVYLPVTETRVEVPRTRLDEFAPVFQFSEFHSIAVSASKERIDSAIRKVTPEEVRFFKTLMRIRFLDTPEGRPILESFTAGAFQALADVPGREIVVGRAGNGRAGGAMTAAEFKTFRRPQLIKIAMNFRIEEIDASHCLVTTETRVYAVGTHALHGFATYWRMIYPGSALIRREWLRAIKARAEGV